MQTSALNKSISLFRLNATEDVISSRLFSGVVESEERNESRHLHHEVDQQRGGRVQREGPDRGHVGERAQEECRRLRGRRHEHRRRGLAQHAAHVLGIGLARKFFHFLESFDDDEDVVHADSENLKKRNIPFFFFFTEYQELDENTGDCKTVFYVYWLLINFIN